MRSSYFAHSVCTSLCFKLSNIGGLHAPIDLERSAIFVYISISLDYYIDGAIY
jgi:hypothetical protein